jgi:hypothetical protein
MPEINLGEGILVREFAVREFEVIPEQGFGYDRRGVNHIAVGKPSEARQTRSRP